MNEGTVTSQQKIRAILYDAGGHDREVGVVEFDLDSLSNEQLLWVDLTGPDPAGLPPEMQSALGTVDNSGSLDIFDNYYRFCIPLREQPGACLRFAVGQSWVLAASEQRPEFFNQFIEADRGKTLKAS